MRQCVNSGV